MKRLLNASFFYASSIFNLCIILVVLLSPIDATSQKKRKKKSSNQQAEQSHVIQLVTGDQTSKYRIVIPSSPSEHELKAADVLQDYLLQISGAALPIIKAGKSDYAHEIILGQNERLDELNIPIDYNSLNKDGLIIKTVGQRLIITGGGGKGTLYGVYTFLETYMGCRMYSPTVKVIPKKDTITLTEINDQQVPVIQFRDTHYRITWDKEYIDWHKLNHDEQGGRPDWGMWVHTFHSLVPPDTYFAEHPEYFAMVNGQRLPTQLCLTNQDVLKITIQNLRKFIAENPEATYWSVSQNDNRNYCTCPNCKAIDDREGSPSGSIIQFVNKVADQFPDKMISTLAYEYGRKAPKTLQPRENVNIMLCSIEINRNLPIEDDPSCADFMREVIEWGKISNDIIVWDYVIQFPNLISPFPNLHVLQPNIQFFAKNGVTALFEQGNREVGGEFAELRAYLISKLMWDPNLDVGALTQDFLEGYYGQASVPIKAYIDEMREALLESEAPLRIFGSPNKASESYLTTDLIQRYEQLFDEADKLAVDSAEILERVRIARLPLDFAIMEQAKKNYYGDNGLFQKVNGNWEVRTDIRTKIDPFTDLCVRQGVTRVKEWSTSPDEYRSSMYRLFALGMKEHLAHGKKVSFISPDPSSLREDAAQMLTDGIRGGHDYEYNWLSFSGKNLEVIIDLEDDFTIRRIESAYFQYGFWLRLFPSHVEYFISKDGKSFKQVGSVRNTLPIDHYGGQQRDFIAEFEPQKARYVKVIAHTIGNTPDWHPGSGRPANMLIDEIVVE